MRITKILLNNYFYLFFLSFLTQISSVNAVIIEDEEVTHHNLKTILTDHVTKNPDLLNSSTGKDIIVVLGNTGAGKSTLLNYLSGKELIVTPTLTIELKDPHDPTAMSIGSTSQSETSLPQAVQIDNLLFYDLPGFKDTKGTANNLANAAFIKTIIENAKSTKLIFVIGMDQLTSNRGDSFLDLLSKITQLIPNEKIDDFSSMTLTKCHIPEPFRDGYIDNMFNLSATQIPGLLTLKYWKDNQDISQMSLPRTTTLDMAERNSILDVIKKTPSKELRNINIDVIYDVKEQIKIKEIYEAEIEEIFNELCEQKISPSSISSLTKASLISKRNYLLKSFSEEIQLACDDSKLVRLLRPLSDNLYQSSWHQKEPILKLRIENFVNLFNEEILEKEKQEEQQRRIQAENNLRQYQQRAIKAEAELRKYQEEEKARQIELQRQQQEKESQEAEIRQKQEVERARQIEAQTRNQQYNSQIQGGSSEEKVRDNLRLTELMRHYNQLLSTARAQGKPGPIISNFQHFNISVEDMNILIRVNGDGKYLMYDYYKKYGEFPECCFADSPRSHGVYTKQGQTW